MAPATKRLPPHVASARNSKTLGPEALIRVSPGACIEVQKGQLSRQARKSVGCIVVDEHAFGGDEVARKPLLQTISRRIASMLNLLEKGCPVVPDTVEVREVGPEHHVRRSKAGEPTSGLFATKNLPAYAVLGVYGGMYYTSDGFEQHVRQKNGECKYAMEVLSMRGRTLVVDATGVDCPVKETNHFKDLTAAGEHQGGKPNAVFMEAQDNRDGLAFTYVVLITTKPVAKDEELLVDYGDKYFPFLGKDFAQQRS